MIAVARAIADRRDTLALGALLRGPLVGLTEEEIADAIMALPAVGENQHSAASSLDGLSTHHQSRPEAGP